MRENNSPWIYQLNRTRPEIPLSKDIDTDVLIVGGGIAGIATVYFTLKYTTRTVCLLESRRIAHGATGHNAGYVVAGFEKMFKDIVAEYGKEMAHAGIQAIEGAWGLFDELINIAGTDIPHEIVLSYGGYGHFEQFVTYLEDIMFSRNGTPLPAPVLIAEESKWFDALPEHLIPLCIKTPHENVLQALETKENTYLAAIPEKTAVTNSAMLTDRILMHCLAQFPDRLTVHEQSPVHGIALNADGGKAFCGEHTVAFKEIVLATNGFENFYIDNNAGAEIDTKFHHQVQGVVGYMTGYLTHDPRPSVAMYFFPYAEVSHDPYNAKPYFYFTRRNFTAEDTSSKLVSIGGPEVHLNDREIYFHEFDVADAIYDSIDQFLKAKEDSASHEKKFHWHGLMGYTTSGLRLIGREPANPTLLYNLGCNGIGILTSIYGGKKIADHLGGKDVPPSIFDPKAK